MSDLFLYGIVAIISIFLCNISRIILIIVVARHPEMSNAKVFYLANMLRSKKSIKK